VNLTTGANDIDIGHPGVAGESNKIRIGRQGTHNGTFIAGISGVAVSGSQVANGTTATPTLVLGSVHVGQSTSASYSIANTGTSGHLRFKEGSTPTVFRVWLGG
jgi:hypothetical protein